MATINQIRALIEAYYNIDNEKFEKITKQIMYHEKEKGHLKAYEQIKNIIQRADTNIDDEIKINKNSTFLELRKPNENIDKLVLNKNLKEKINTIIDEYDNKEILFDQGLCNNRKLLFVGPPGTGKTMTASVFSDKLNLPLYTLKINTLLSSYLGTSVTNLKKIFDQMKEYKGVYLFDEFDSIGADRNNMDVGEMRRVLNSFLQYIEEDISSNIIICITNSPNILDYALFRRFDDVLEYKMPTEDEIQKLIELNLEIDILDIEILNTACGLNHSDIVRAIENTKKHCILKNKKINKSILLKYLVNRKDFYKYK